MAFIKSKKEMLSMQKTYVTDARIGNAFGVSRQAVHQIRQKYGVPAIADKNEKRNALIKKRYVKGVGVNRICAEYGLSISQIYRIVKGY